MMAPTELLARQHIETLQPILHKLGISCGLLVSAMRAKEKREIIDEISSGKLSVIIGTHAVLRLNGEHYVEEIGKNRILL